MIKYCRIIIKATQSKTWEQFEEDIILNMAVVYAILNLGELMKNVAETDKSAFSNNIPWKDIVRFRNVAAHGYENIQLPLAWNMATKQIPQLLTELQQKAAELAKQTEPTEPTENPPKTS